MQKRLSVPKLFTLKRSTRRVMSNHNIEVILKGVGPDREHLNHFLVQTNRYERRLFHNRLLVHSSIEFTTVKAARAAYARMCRAR